MHLLEVLREECGIVSAKNGCAPEGACGCCLVMIDGTPALSCLRKPEQTEGREVVTLEGLPEDVRKRMGDAFVLEGGVQCGFCIPGIVVRAASLVAAGQDRRPRRRSPRRSTGTCAAAPATDESSTPFRRPAKRRRAVISCTRTEPRRHLYFGEQFGLTRNPAFCATGTGNGKQSHGIGHSISRLGGAEQTLGDKQFVDDLRVPGMLHGAMVLTEHPRARILKIHVDEAAAMPGVVRVFTAADVPGFRGQGLNDPDQPVFVAEGELTCCVADFLAMVVADTQFHARQAAAKVRIDYEVLEPLTDPFEALKPGAPLVHPPDTFAPRPSNILQPTTAFSRGDVDAALTSGRARHRSDVRNAADRDRIPRARSVPRRCRRATASR